jgi:hypothetical protein
VKPHPLSPPLHEMERGTGGEVKRNANYNSKLKIISQKPFDFLI